MKIYNSMSKQKDEFKTLQPNEVSMYACGITPYSESHLGHGVAAIRFNAIRQYLKYQGYNVTFVQNVTNVDDKLIQKGKETHRSPIEIGDQHTQEYRNLMKEMGIEAPNSEPDVISYMSNIVDYIGVLINKGYAYATCEGNVYFDVNKKEGYGKLSGRNLEELKVGVRVDAEQDKKHPLDFALWKSDNHEEMSWPSPWGQGRPGWHIECSVMSNALLGPKIDIHCGGLDLIFPHHENEIAQCEAHNDCDFASYWVHSGLLNINGRKMSKSDGNFFTLREALDKYSAELIKFVILRHHYRSEVDFSDEMFSDNLNMVLKFIRAFDLIENEKSTKPEAGNLSKLKSAFTSAMDDDFNTPNAIVALHEALEGALEQHNSQDSSKASLSILAEIKKYCEALGLFNTGKSVNDASNELLSFHARSLGMPALTVTEIEKSISERKKARDRADYTKADEVRIRLHDAGIKLLDSRERPTTWQFRMLTK